MIISERYDDHGPRAHHLVGGSVRRLAFPAARPYNAGMLGAMNLVGAVTGVAYYVSCVLVFLLRISGRPHGDRAVGFAQMLFVLPLALLLVTAPGLSRPALFYVQNALLLAFVVFEGVADTILHVDLRSTRWTLIAYVVFFFAATGGMLGVIALSGQTWLLAGVAGFLAAAGLAFAQRAVTGA
jgi:hypothetical protein